MRRKILKSNIFKEKISFLVKLKWKNTEKLSKYQLRKLIINI